MEERKYFYEKEFDIDGIEKWLDLKPVVIDIGSETTLYTPKFKKYLNKLVRIKYSDLEELKSKLIEYAPEDVYYEFGKKELIFDLDPDNILCAKCNILKKDLVGKFKIFSFCADCFAELTFQTKEMFGLLSKHFSEIKLIYSGRGFHIHINLKDIEMSDEEKIKFVGMMKKKFPIDPWVTTKKNLIRLPGTLNSLVSRRCMEIEVESLNDIDSIINKEAVPEFLLK